MSTEKHDTAYGERTILRVIILIGALMGVGVFIIPNVEYGPKVSPLGWGIIALWSVILVAGTIWAGRVQRRYHCPECSSGSRHQTPAPLSLPDLRRDLDDGRL